MGSIEGSIGCSSIGGYNVVVRGVGSIGVYRVNFSLPPKIHSLDHYYTLFTPFNPSFPFPFLPHSYPSLTYTALPHVILQHCYL